MNTDAHPTKEVERFSFVVDTRDDRDPWPTAVLDPDGYWVRYESYAKACKERDQCRQQAEINAQTVIRQASEIRKLEQEIGQMHLENL